MVPQEKLDQICARFAYLEAKMADGSAIDEIAKLSKEYSDLKPVVDQINTYKNIIFNISETEEMLLDPEMKILAEEELPSLKARLPIIEHKLLLSLLPKDDADNKPAIIEIRAGTGGDEAALFAGDLLRMYNRFCEDQGWKFEVVEGSETELGGYKEAIALM